jgi:limonene-1,2-epoxide hydrolase
LSNIQTVLDFLHAWDENDFDAAFALMAPDIAYKNTGYPDAFGHEGVRTTLAALISGASPMTSVVHAIAETSDGTVMTERTDTLHLPSGPLPFGVMGAFDVKNGLIAGWRDYFDASLFKPS